MQAQETSFIFKTYNPDKKKSQIYVWSLLFSTSYSYCLFRNAVRGPFSAVREQSLCGSQPKPRELGSSCRKQFWGVAGAEMTAAQAACDRAPQHTQSRRSAQTAPVLAGRGAGPPFLFSARYHSLINSTGASVLLLRGNKRNCSPDPTYSAFSFANLSPLSCALAPHGGQADTWGGRACRTQLPARGAPSARTGAGVGLPGAVGPGSPGWQGRARLGPAVPGRAAEGAPRSAERGREEPPARPGRAGGRAGAATSSAASGGRGAQPAPQPHVWRRSGEVAGGRRCGPCSCPAAARPFPSLGRTQLQVRALGGSAPARCPGRGRWVREALGRGRRGAPWRGTGRARGVPGEPRAAGWAPGRDSFLRTWALSAPSRGRGAADKPGKFGKAEGGRGAESRPGTAGGSRRRATLPGWVAAPGKLRWEAGEEKNCSEHSQKTFGVCVLLLFLF